MTNSVLAGAKSIGQHLFGGYAELLRIPHTARFSVGSVIACMPFPMVGMTITISVQHYYCLLYTSPSPRDRQKSGMPASA